MTQLTITPKVADKTARFKGTIAAGERVAVTVKGGAEWGGTDSGANLTLRVLDMVTGRTLAVFPRPTETLETNETPDAWSESEADENDLYCELNLNTTRMVAAARHMLRVPVMFVLGDTDDPRTLYFRDKYEVEYWPERIGDTTPYDLDKWPKKIDEWTELVVAWATQMSNFTATVDDFVDAQGRTGAEITMWNGDAETQPTSVKVYDGKDGEDGDMTEQATKDLIEDYLEDYQLISDFDTAPTADSTKPVTSGGIKTAIDTVATNLSTHTGNSGIHVSSSQKSAWTAKYDKPSGGIPKTDLASGVQASLGLADSALQSHQSLASYVNGGTYDSTSKKILLQHGSSTIAEIDATAFIKDGMVSSVAISNGYLVITFNTDAGTNPISIALTDIFNPSNYYDKTAADGRYVQKESGKGLVSVDETLSVHGAAADAKAVGDALRSGFTDWEFSGSGYDPIVTYSVEIEEYETESDVFYIASLSGSDGTMETSSVDSFDTTSVTFPSAGITATRHLITPTKTSQLQNDGAPNGGGNAYVMTNDTRLTDARTPTAHTHAIADVTGLGAALAQKANKSELPYDLVEIGDWELSGSGYDPSEAYVISYDSGTSKWQLSLDMQVIGEASGDASDNVVEFQLVEGTIIATRNQLLDRASNKVTASSATTLVLPAALDGGKLRDFLVRLTIPANTTLTGLITFADPTGETIEYETDGDEFPVPDDVGKWLYSFTETDDGLFDVSLKKVNTVVQGGGT